VEWVRSFTWGEIFHLGRFWE